MPGACHGFVDRLLLGVLRDLHAVEPGNIDPWRLPPGRLARVGRHLLERAWGAAGRAGLQRRGYGVGEALAKVEFVLAHRAELDRLHGALADHRSRDLLERVLAYRILGGRHVRLPLNTPRYWDVRRQAGASRRAANTAAVAGAALHLFEPGGRYGALRLHAQEAHVVNTFLLEQYCYQHTQPPVGVKPGDVVLDLGGGWGDTALYFAHRAGPEGRIYSFECMPENQAIFRRNLELNPELASRITLVPAAAWSVSGETIRFIGGGPSSRVTGDGAVTASVPSLAVDDFVRDHRLDRVDVIKMDIEGSEARALAGARGTIGRCRPALAVALYHRDDDFIDIPACVRDSGVTYDIFLDHFTIYDEETVLFAQPRA